MSADTGLNGSDELVSEARALGWVPKEEFRGDVSKWVDAEQFVEHGKRVMPILRKNNEALMAVQRTTQQQVDKLMRELEAARSDLKTMEDFHNEEVIRRTQETRQQLLAQIREAKQSGDVDAEMTATEQLTDLTAAQRKAESETVDAEEQAAPTGPTLTPEVIAWQAKNPWFDQDQERTYLAMAIAAGIAKERPELKNVAFYAELDRRLAATENGGRQPPGKVEGSTGGRSNGSAGGKSYADLPADVKATCDKYAKRFVNPNGKFKTEQDYRKHYIQQLEDTGYFNQ